MKEQEAEGLIVQGICPECGQECRYYDAEWVKVYLCRDTCETAYAVPADETEELAERVRWYALELVQKGIPMEIRRDWI